MSEYLGWLMQSGRVAPWTPTESIMTPVAVQIAT
jgi:hypothetical protein